MVALRYRLVPVFALLLVVACQATTPGPGPVNPTLPTLTLTPASINISAGGAPATFVATVQNSSETVTWVYSGPGSIAPSSGPVTTYTSPSSVDSTQSGSLTATLGSTGVNATAPIVIYPEDVAPPTDPPPTTPTMSVSIADTSPVMIGEAGTATATLNASTRNAPGSTTYKWTAQGNNPGTVSFSSATTEDTTATFSVAGTYTLRLSARAGSRSASDTASITVNPAPEPTENAAGLWNATFIAEGVTYTFSLDLAVAGEDVTGTWTYIGADYPVTGTFIGDKLEITTVVAGTTIKFDATVAGDAMTGTLATPTETYAFTATRQPAP